MTTSVTTGTGGPTESSLRRALRRARDGVSLDVSEAAVLLQARGEHLQDLSASAARVRDAGLEAAGRPGVITYSKSVFVPLTRLCRDKCHYCTFVTVPGKLRRAGHGMFMSPDEVLDIARKGAALGCKEALITLGDKPEDRWPEAREWLDAHGYDDTIAYVRAISIRGDGTPPAPQPGRHDLDGLPAPQAGRAVDGHDAGDDGDPPVVRARRPAPRLPGQGTGRAAAGPRGRGPLLGPLHLRHPHRHRRDLRGARRVAVRPPQDLPRPPRHPGTDHPELPRQAGHRDARHAGRGTRRAGRHGRRRPARPRPRRLSPGAAEPGRRRVRAADRGRDRRLGRGLPAHHRPRQPRAALAEDRGTGRAVPGGRLRAARTPLRLPGVRAARRAVAGSAAAPARGRARRPGHRSGAPRRPPGGAALAGAGRGVHRDRPHRPAPHHRHRGAYGRPPRGLRRGLRRLGRPA
jgi:hypothetical protein